MITITTMMKTMDFDEFIRKMTRSVKDSNAHIMAFVSDGERMFLVSYGNEAIIAATVAKAMTENPHIRSIMKAAVNLIEMSKMKVTVINTEDEANDYLIDLHLKNKHLNDSEEGL